MGLLIPKKIRAGDTLDWTDSVSDYPASSGYTLKYVLAADNIITLTGIANGSDYDFDVAAADTAKWVPGTYSYQAYVTDGTKEFTIEVGTLEVLVNLRVQKPGYDGRSHVKIVLDALEATIEGRATKQHSSISIAGRAISLLPPAELRKEYLHYKHLYRRELETERIAAGLDAKNKIVSKFTNPL
jgi:hypothetical protein